MKKTYSTPQIRTEFIEVGVFGNYGCGDGDDGGGYDWNPVQFFNPFFYFCCS
jgi:hypothetical protein